MILEGNERGYGAELARHLLNPRDNDHVTVHAVEGFMADDLFGAFAEADAVSQATQCQKYLFSLSLNPPQDQPVAVEVFEEAITTIEKKLGLVGQPRAIVFHEKNGRRHAHCVWSRIDASHMRAINLPHYKRKLGDVSRELYLEQNWDMPEGFRDAAKRDPDNFSRQEGGQANRHKRDPKTQKAMFRRCWEGSDSRAAFAAALKEEGYLLARGDRRGFVAVDADGKIWSLSRWCGVKPKDLRARLGGEDDLPTAEEAFAQIGDLPRPQKDSANSAFEARRTKLVARQREDRAALLKTQKMRRIEELKARKAGQPKGLRAVFLRVTGRYQKHLRDGEAALQASLQRNRTEQQQLVEAHLIECRALSQDLRRSGLRDAFSGHATNDPSQILVSPSDDLPLSRAQLLQNPALILEHISYSKARFNRTDVLRALTKRIDDPMALAQAAGKAMSSSELIRIPDKGKTWFTTRDYRTAEENLQAAARRMCGSGGFGVTSGHVVRAMEAQGAHMMQAFGGRLSNEQRTALTHVLSDRQLANVVGLAGAGKSTMLATAMDAWRRQGITVHGAALAGKAADGLESASGIQSRTLASLEMSWANGHEPISKGEVLVVDEAGMIGTRQLARVTAKIEEIGAKLVLVGDPDQLQPIEAGTPFRDLVTDNGAARLTEIHRQREEWQKQASLDLAEGRIAKAVDTYRQRSGVTQGEDAFDALVESYAMDAAANGSNASRLAFAHRRKDVHALNQAIRAALRFEGEPSAEILLSTETGPRAFAAGDRIVFGKNDRSLDVKNGMLGTVQQASQSELTITLDGDQAQKITFDPRLYRHFDHGYAVTIHKSQGATVDLAYVLASHTMDRHLAYVAMTRHRDAMHLYVRDEDRPKWAHAPRQNVVGRDPPKRSGPSMG